MFCEENSLYFIKLLPETLYEMFNTLTEFWKLAKEEARIKSLYQSYKRR